MDGSTVSLGLHTATNTAATTFVIVAVVVKSGSFGDGRSETGLIEAVCWSQETTSGGSVVDGWLKMSHHHFCLHARGMGLHRSCCSGFIKPLILVDYNRGKIAFLFFFSLEEIN